ncbi:hypothetical protein [Bremerella alba]|uniref:Uncharacterized protein n=1 Tax=Bremerella alba TaxID=980252 RepID=A0A7V8V512_9BACT|nr:hypothetical protein [Bremerella alba]MBA2115069.1 hypothetical protein [Bremerella alba]
MTQQKLNTRNRRVDVDLDNESTALFVSNGSSKRSLDCTTDGLAKAVAAKQLVAVNLDQDDGIFARVVFGQANKQEREEAIEQGCGKLDLSVGVLAVAGGNAYVFNEIDAKEQEEEYGEYFQTFEVTPGEYLVTVYTLMGSYNAFRVTRREGWKGFLPWFRQTRSRKKFPGWLMEYALLQGEDVDAIPEGKIEEDNDDQEPLGFVIQLTPATDQDELSPLERGYQLDMEPLEPEKCPLGILPKGLSEQAAIEEPPKKAEPKKPAKAKAPSVDKKAMAEHFRPFAEALFNQEFDKAAEFFIESLRGEALEYMTIRRQRRSRWEPLNKIWLSRGNAEETVSEWRSEFEKDYNLFAPDEVSIENYLGDIRCEYGKSSAYASGKIRRYLIVDCALIQTADGPKLAGIYFSS